MNNFDCVLSPDLVSSTSIAAEVCCVHVCHDQCKFFSDHCSVSVGHKSVSVDKLHFEHGYNC